MRRCCAHENVGVVKRQQRSTMVNVLHGRTLIPWSIMKLCDEEWRGASKIMQNLMIFLWGLIDQCLAVLRGVAWMLQAAGKVMCKRTHAAIRCHQPIQDYVSICEWTLDIYVFFYILFISFYHCSFYDFLCPLFRTFPDHFQTFPYIMQIITRPHMISHGVWICCRDML